MVNVFQNATETIFPNQVTTTIIQGQVKQKGLFDGVGSFFSRIGPVLPWILGLAVLGILIFLAWSFLKKQGKLFQKDYAKESYKEKVRFYSRNPTRISSSKWGWSFAIFFLVAGISLIAGILVFGLALFGVSKFPTVWVIVPDVIIIIALVVLNLMNPRLWTSFPKAVDSTGNLIGFLLSEPMESPDGYLEALIFKKMRWGFFKQVDILSVPVLSEFAFIKKDPTTGKRIVKSFSISKPVGERYKILGTGDLLVNSSSFYGTRFHIYPNYSDPSKTFDLREFTFLKEKKEGDLLNLTDLSNEFRENAVILAGGNPHNRISGDGANPKRENFEE